MPFFSSALMNSDCGGEIGLIGGNDVAARIAMLRIVQHLVIEIGRETAASAESATAASAGSIAAGRTRRGSRRRRVHRVRRRRRPPPPAGCGRRFQSRRCAWA